MHRRINVRSYAGCPLVVCFFLALLMASAPAISLPLGKDTRKIDLSGQLLYFEDKGHRYSADAIIGQGAPVSWQRQPDGIASFGYSDSVFWFMVDLENRDVSNQSWVLETDYPQISQYDVYFVHSDGSRKVYYSGLDVPFSQRYWQHRHLITPFELEQGESVRVYFRVKSQYAVQMPLVVWNKDAYIPASNRAQLVQALFFGIVLAMILYNAFLSRFTGDYSYGYYVVYVASIGVWQFITQGFAYQYFTVFLYNGGTTAVFVFAIFSFCAAFIFIDDLLQLRFYAPVFHKIIISMVGVGAIILLLSFFVKASIMFPVLIAFVAPTSIFALLVGVHAWRKKSAYAPYFVLAWSAFLLGVVLYGLNKVGIIPRTFITENASQMGVAIEVILLSLALADKINSERAQKLAAREEAVVVSRRAEEIERRSKLQLELVKEETNALSSALDHMADYNKVLMEENIQDELTGIYNRRHFSNRLEDLWQQAKRANSPISLLLIDLDNFKELNDKHGHSFGDDCLYMAANAMAGCCRRQDDMVARYGGEEFAMILPGCGLEIAMQIAEEIRQSVERIVPTTPSGKNIVITASIGVSMTHPAPDISELDLIDAADNALYRAKGAGRNQVASKVLVMNFRSR